MRVNKEVLSKKIKLLRISRGETMEEFGKLLSASKGNVAMWESGKVSPNPKRIMMICNLLNINISEVLE